MTPPAQETPREGELETGNAKQRPSFTPLRREVLALLQDSHPRPVRAYALLEALQGQRKHAVAPATVYRTLDFLLAQGLVHRLETLNAYVACTMPDVSHNAQFWTCAGCGMVTECHDAAIENALSERAAAAEFELEDRVIEIAGRCSKCSG
ncbi:MAG: Fur family transcriptional regulator [Gammaproteobacteria bacterium]